MYFVKKLLNLKGDDGYEMNQVLVAFWYVMGLWPLVYSMLHPLYLLKANLFLDFLGGLRVVAEENL